MNTWKNGPGGEVFKIEWERITTKLKNSRLNLNIPLTAKVEDEEEEVD